MRRQIKLLIGGSPCTHWSIAQTKNRETELSGLGWELFKNYLIAREKYKPDYFLYENNKSMSAAIRAQITKELGVEPVLINSSLVSAQNRQRLYWVGRRMLDGTYAPLDIQKPEDRGILLRDIMETGYPLRKKSYALLSVTHSATLEDAIARRQRNAAAEPVEVKPLSEREMEYMVRETKDGRNHFDFDYHHDTTKDKSSCVTANVHRGVPYNVCCECVNPTEPAGINRLGGLYGQHTRWGIYDPDGKVPCITASAGMGGGHLPMWPERIGTIENQAKNPDHDSQQYRVYSPDAKSVTLCGAGGVLEQRRDCMLSLSAPVMRVREATKRGYVDVLPGECVDLSMPNSKTRRGRAMNVAYNKDCMTALREFPDQYFDLAVVDPPYGIGENGDKAASRSHRAAAQAYTPFEGADKEPPPPEYFAQLARVSKNQIIFGANHFASRLPKIDTPCWIVWDKQNGESDFADFEMAWTSFRSAARMFRFRWAGMFQGNMKQKEIRIHPTQKPVALYAWIYSRYAHPGDKILDTHLGSGSSRIAAWDAGLDFVGYEKSRTYFEAQEQRFTEHTAQLSIFGGGLIDADQEDDLQFTLF